MRDLMRREILLLKELRALTKSPGQFMAKLELELWKSRVVL